MVSRRVKKRSSCGAASIFPSMSSWSIVRFFAANVPVNVGANAGGEAVPPGGRGAAVDGAGEEGAVSLNGTASESTRPATALPAVRAVLTPAQLIAPYRPDKEADRRDDDEHLSLARGSSLAELQSSG